MLICHPDEPNSPELQCVYPTLTTYQASRIALWKRGLPTASHGWQTCHTGPTSTEQKLMKDAIEWAREIHLIISCDYKFSIVDGTEIIISYTVTLIGGIYRRHLLETPAGGKKLWRANDLKTHDACNALRGSNELIFKEETQWNLFLHGLDVPLGK